LLFEASNYRDLSNKIMIFIKNKKEYKKKSKFAHMRLFRFNLNLNLKKYLDVVNDLMLLKSN